MLEHYVLVSRLKEEDKVMTKAISKSSYILREEVEVQVQEKHLEEILCLKLVTHLEILVKLRCDYERLSHIGVWGSNM